MPIRSAYNEFPNVNLTCSVLLLMYLILGMPINPWDELRFHSKPHPPLFYSNKRKFGDVTFTIPITTKFGSLNETIRFQRCKIHKIMKSLLSDESRRVHVPVWLCAARHFFPFVHKYGENNGTVRSNQLNAGLNNLTICFNIQSTSIPNLPLVQQFRCVTHIVVHEPEQCQH